MKNKILFAIMLVGSMITFASCKHSSKDDPTPDFEGTTQNCVIVYGTLGGSTDEVFENFITTLQQVGIDQSKARYVICYKYGKAEKFTGKYAKPGDVVFFELTNKTNLNQLSKDFVDNYPELEMFDEANFAFVLDAVKEEIPAENYHLLIMGHGGGLDLTADYDEPATENAPRRAMLYDEWLPGAAGVKSMSIYELNRGIEMSQIKHFKSIFLHSCLMGNVEVMTEIHSKADYIFASAHIMFSNGANVVSYCYALQTYTDIAKMGEALFTDDSEWGYKAIVDSKRDVNEDLALIKCSEVPALIPIFRAVNERLQALYPTQKDVINMASAMTYNVYNQERFYDAAEFVNQVASATDDAELKKLKDQLDAAFKKIIVQQVTRHNSKDGDIDNFTLTLVLVDKTEYNKTRDWGFTYKQAYEQTSFHKQTGWGNWLDLNEQKLPAATTPFGNMDQQ